MIRNALGDSMLREEFIMKKKYVWLVCMLLSFAVVGCSGKDTNDAEQTLQEIQTTVAPVQAETTKKNTEENADDEELVYMQKTVREKEENVIGNKTETAAKMTIINQTGAEISSLYIRPHTENYYDGNWGDELIQGTFTLKNGEKAVYYFETNQKDDYGNTISIFDIRITYTEVGKDECFFRKLPLNIITEIRLCMENTEGTSIPYAKYLSRNSEKEVSTLQEVKQRLGYTSNSSDAYPDLEDADTSGYDSSTTDTGGYEDTSTSQDTGIYGDTGSNTDSDIYGDTGSDTNSDGYEDSSQGGYGDGSQTGENDSGSSGSDGGYSDSGIGNDLIATAESCVGKTLDELIGMIGEPTGGSDYEKEPETGETGYHYYDNFTISTTFDENQNEIVAGVW